MFLLGVLKSLRYPNNYPDDMVEDIHLKAPEGQRIQITFNAFIIKETTPCLDYLKVNDGDGSELMEPSCGQTGLNKVIISNTNTVTISFFSDSKDNKKGYLAEWVFVESTVPSEATTLPSEANATATEVPQNLTIECVPLLSGAVWKYDGVHETCHSKSYLEMQLGLFHV